MICAIVGSVRALSFALNPVYPFGVHAVYEIILILLCIVLENVC